MRDAICIPISEEEQLVITSDNSGAIGMKDEDAVQVPYETVGYFSLRVAIMECMATGAVPISIVIQNFCGDEAWEELVSGVRKGLFELEMENIAITGSTESNFSLSQSAMGLSVIGKRSNIDSIDRKDVQDMQVALIGLPLVGDEVVSQADRVAPLSVFKAICKVTGVTVWPVGSKGILYELERMYPGIEKDRLTSTSSVDLKKSGGPSTSFLVSYPSRLEQKIINLAEEHYIRLL